MKNQTFLLIAAGLIAASILFWVYMFQDSPSSTTNPDLNGEIVVTMYHGPGCMCCIRWADYLENEGFTVVEERVNNLYDIKQEKGVPMETVSCHTAVVDGYVVEGHVPADDIRRLLTERPDAIGIAVPGMPPSAPGMDAPVSRPYDVIYIDRDQNMSVYNTHE